MRSPIPMASNTTSIAPAPISGTWMQLLMKFKSKEDLHRYTLSSFSKVADGVPGAVFIVGASPLGASLASSLIRHRITVAGIFDHDSARHYTLCEGITVQPFEALGQQDRYVPVIMATHRLAGLHKELDSMGFKAVWPFPLLSILDKQAYPPHPFYAGLQDDLFEHRNELIELSASLADQQSREVLDSQIGFRLTLDARILLPVITSDAYFTKDVLRFTPEEVVVDGGAFNGDTVTLFKEITRDTFARIIAVEPSKESFVELEKTYADDDRITLVNACLYDKEATVTFDASSARDSSILSEGGAPCAAITIDSLECSNDISIIKLNIEGAEYEALQGARNTIARRKPKLAIAVYHMPQDIWRLPKLVMNLCPDYKLYMRQHNGGIIETVIYTTTPA